MAKAQLLRLKRATRNQILTHVGVQEVRFVNATKRQLDELEEYEWFSTFEEGLTILECLNDRGFFPKKSNYQAALMLLETAGLPYDLTELYLWIVGHGRQYEGEVFDGDVTLHLIKGTAWPLPFARFAKQGGPMISMVLNTLHEAYAGLVNAVMEGLCTVDEACRLFAQTYENGFAFDEDDSQLQYSRLPAGLRRRLNTIVMAFKKTVEVSCPMVQLSGGECHAIDVDKRKALQGVHLADFQDVVWTLQPKPKMRLEIITVDVDQNAPTTFCWHATSGERVPATAFSDLNGGAAILEQIRTAGGFQNDREFMRTFQLLSQVTFQTTPAPEVVVAPVTMDVGADQAPAPDASDATTDNGNGQGNGTDDQPGTPVGAAN